MSDVDYGDIDRVRAILQVETGPDSDRFDALNTIASRELEQACGVSGFGDLADDRTLTRDVGRRRSLGTFRELLYLGAGIRTVSAVTIDDVALDSESYRFAYEDAVAGAFALERIDGGTWGGRVVITGQWSDQPDGEEVAAQVVEAVSVLIAGYIRKDRTGDGEVSGAEGLTFKPGDPWNDQRVKRVIARYQTPAVLLL